MRCVGIRRHTKESRGTESNPAKEPYFKTMPTTPQRFQLALCILGLALDFFVEMSLVIPINSPRGQWATRYQKNRSRKNSERERNTSRAVMNPAMVPRVTVALCCLRMRTWLRSKVAATNARKLDPYRHINGLFMNVVKV